MQLEARVKTIIDLFDVFFATSSPFDIVMAKYFKNHKWIGAADRRAVAEFSYSIFRCFEKLKLINKNITENFGRFFVLSFLKHEKKYSEKQIDEIFTGRKYAPSKLTDFERKFINAKLPAEFPKHTLLNYPAWLESYLSRSFSNDSFKEKGLSFNPIDILCITHFHADHISGLPGLLLTMGNAERTEPLTIIGPKGLERVVSAMRVIAPELPFEIHCVEMSEQHEYFEINGYCIHAFRVKHNVVCYG